MSNKLYEENDIQNIANAIRNKNGTEDTYKVSQMSTAIDSIEVIESATAEGENLSLTNTKAMPYSDYVVEGKSEQTTRSGKNLWNDNDMLLGYWAYADGTYIRTNTWICTPKIACKGNVDYTFQFANNSRWYGFVWYDENNNFISTANQQNNLQTGFRSFTAKSPSNAGYLAINIAGYPGTNDTIRTDDLINFQLEESSTATDYEPYGASPSPDYPSEIHSVADDVNLFDASKIKNSDIVVTDNGKTITLPIVFSGGGGISGISKLSELCPDLQVGDYIYLNFTRNLGKTYNNIIYLVGSNREIYNASAYSFNTGTTITQQDLDSIVYFYANRYSDGETQQCILTDFKIQKNKTTPYSPYNQGTVTIKQRGKNENDGINYGFYIGAEATTYRISGADNGLCIPIENEVYTISSKEIQNRYRIACSNSLPSNTSQNCFNGVVKDGTNDNVTIDTSGYKYLLINCTNINDIQIEEGTQATPYEPYQANDYTIQTAPLRSLPNGVKDTIELQDMQNHTRIGRQTGTLTETTIITLSDAKSNGAYMCNIKSAGTLTGQTIELEAGDYEIIYELANEVIEPLTQNQATTMLDIIKTGSYDCTTNIYTDEDVKPTMEVDYYKKK